MRDAAAFVECKPVASRKPYRVWRAAIRSAAQLARSGTMTTCTACGARYSVADRCPCCGRLEARR